MNEIWYRNPSKSEKKKPNDHAEPTKVER